MWACQTFKINLQDILLSKSSCTEMRLKYPKFQTKRCDY